MNHESTANEAEMTLLLDRFVCDEIDETSRRRLVDWLEAAPQRWRLCGLAFLESQMWCTAIHDAPQVADDQRRWITEPQPGAPLQLGSAQRVRAWRPGHAAALAACVLVAFLSGFSLGGFTGRPSQGPHTSTADQRHRPIDKQPLADDGQPQRAGEPVLAALSVQPGLGFADTTTVRIPVVPTAETSAAGDPAAAIPDYVRQQWERRGYRLSVERRYLFAKLPDGEQVVVPVNQVVVNRVPSKVY